MKSLLRSSVVIAALVVTSCRGDVPVDDSWIDRAAHRDAFVELNDLRINYLDWGGEGEAVILLHGAWANPHYWDALAPHLAADYRVLALARRGLGKSEIPSAEFGVDELVEDLRLFMDQLEIERAHLIGWSFAGYELTRFAGLYPDRTGNLVYVDAHFEFADDEPLVPFRLSAFDEYPPLGPDAAHLVSIDSYREWFQSTLVPELAWTPELEAWIRALVEPAPDGGLRERRDPVVQASYNRISTDHRRDYESVRAPALALFAERFLIGPADPALAQAAAGWNERFSIPGREIAMRRYREGLSDVRMISYPGTSHESLVHHNPTQIAGDILAFLAIH